MAEPIGRADWELRADQTGLVKDLGDAEKKVASSGAAVQKSAINTGTAFKAGAAVAAVGFGLMTKGSQEMERSQGDFQAATGKSRDEAVAFSKDMNGLVGTAGTVGMSFDKLSDTGVEVARQFGATGEEGKAMTESFAEFAKVTGGDSVEAVKAMDGTLDAFHLPAEKATELMDELVASNQKYGTEVGPQTVDMLGKMAPALQAMGGDLDDGVALLNMFEDSGLDAAGAMRGLNTAVKNLPPGTTLEEFLQHLQDLKDQGIDPTQEAIAVFGAKAGTGIANAIKPGQDALDTYRVSAEDADGATREAAENMLTTGDKIKMFAEKAGAALRGMGQEFGPILSGAGGLVSVFGALPGKVTGPLVDGMKAVWKKLIPGAIAGGTAAGAAEAEASTVAATETGMVQKWIAKFSSMTGSKVAAAAAAGALEGEAEGMASAEASAGPGVLAKFTGGGKLAGLAMGAGLVLGVAAAATVVGPAAGKLGEETGRTVFGGIAKQFGNTEDQGMLAGTVFDSLTDGIHTGLDNVMDSAVMRFNIFKDGRWMWMSPSAAEVAAAKGVNEFGAALARHAADERADFAVVGTTAAESVTTGYGDGIKALEQIAAQSVVGAAAAAQVAAEAPFVALGRGIPKDIADGAIDNGTALVTAGDRLITLLKEGLSPAEEAARLEGEKYTKAVAQGVISEIPGAKEAAQQMAVQAITTIEKAGEGGTTKGLKAIGSYYDSLLASGLKANDIAVALSAAGVADDVITKLTGLYPTVTETGKTWDSKLASGINQNSGAINTAVNTAVEPMKHVGPVDQWGRAVGSSWGTALVSEIRGFKGNVSQAARWATVGLAGASPPKEGPLHFIDKWGENVAGAWVGGMVSGVMHGKDKLDGAIGRLDFSPKVNGLKLPGDMVGPVLRPTEAMPRQHDAGGDCVHLHIGTLVADEAGLAELSRRMEHAASFGSRKRLPVGGAY